MTNAAPGCCTIEPSDWGALQANPLLHEYFLSMVLCADTAVSHEPGVPAAGFLKSAQEPRMSCCVSA